jgi:hypothetical protein
VGIIWRGSKSFEEGEHHLDEWVARKQVQEYRLDKEDTIWQGR